MSTWFSTAACWGAMVCGFAGVGLGSASAQETPAEKAAKANVVSDKDKVTDKETPKDQIKPSKIETATFGGGCFWCLEAVFERLKGVKDVRSGYAGGDDTIGQPSYEMVGTGRTGHAEVVQIDFDSSIISYDDLLDVFWLCHDPTSLNAQGPDHGTQYRSVILYNSETQRKEANKSYEKVTAQKWFKAPIVTQLVPLTHFFPAEGYHQDYYRQNKYASYCQMVISPKLKHVTANLAKKAKLEESIEKEKK